MPASGRRTACLDTSLLEFPLAPRGTASRPSSFAWGSALATETAIDVNHWRGDPGDAATASRSDGPWLVRAGRVE